MRNLSYPAGLQHYLWAHRTPFKDFSKFSAEITERVIAASERHAKERGREIRYLPCSSASKEEIARAIAARDDVREGLICVLRCVEPCMSFQINKSQLCKSTSMVASGWPGRWMAPASLVVNDRQQLLGSVRIALVDCG
ncbi:MAG: hypothetical protein L0Y71_12955 [Gemmataceae bacterium]|nr:hypothetical protein [Gemmataceae bacterium]